MWCKKVDPQKQFHCLPFSNWHETSTDLKQWRSNAYTAYTFKLKTREGILQKPMLTLSAGGRSWPHQYNTNELNSGGIAEMWMTLRVNFYHISCWGLPTPADNAEHSVWYCCCLLWLHTVRGTHMCTVASRSSGKPWLTHNRSHSHMSLTEDECNEQRAGTICIQMGITCMTWRGEGEEEGMALPPAAWRCGLKHPQTCTTTPRPKKVKNR